MPSDPTYQKIADLLHEVDAKLQPLGPEAIRGKHLRQEIGLDSLDVLKFVLLAEERFACRLPEDEIDKRDLLKVDNLAAYLAEHGAR